MLCFGSFVVRNPLLHTPHPRTLRPRNLDLNPRCYNPGRSGNLGPSPLSHFAEDIYKIKYSKLLLI